MGPVIFVSIITSAIVSAGVSIAFQEGMFAPDVEVPDLTGMSIDAARGVSSASRLRLVHRGERHDDTVPEGDIVEQQPRSGSLVPQDSEITVILSLGPDLVEVPAVAGITPSAAHARLSNAGLRASDEVRAASGGQPGMVASSDPPEGQRVARGSVITLSVTPEQTTITLPDFVGQQSRAAREAIVAAGLVVGRTRMGFNGDRPPYIVLSQSPAAGTEVEPGSEVELVINEE
jgi:beta-lactam-binding protein with PASTA domain